MRCECKDTIFGYVYGIDCSGEVKIRTAMTSYHWDESAGKPDPNRDLIFCDAHYDEYYAFWKEQWDEYYSMTR